MADPCDKQIRLPLRVTNCRKGRPWQLHQRCRHTLTCQRVNNHLRTGNYDDDDDGRRLETHLSLEHGELFPSFFLYSILLTMLNYSYNVWQRQRLGLRRWWRGGWFDGRGVEPQCMYVEFFSAFLFKFILLTPFTNYGYYNIWHWQRLLQSYNNDDKENDSMDGDSCMYGEFFSVFLFKFILLTTIWPRATTYDNDDDYNRMMMMKMNGMHKHGLGSTNEMGSFYFLSTSFLILSWTKTGTHDYDRLGSLWKRTGEYVYIEYLKMSL